MRKKKSHEKEKKSTKKGKLRWKERRTQVKEGWGEEIYGFLLEWTENA